MNAREMFKSLGYKRHESENGIQYFSESGVEITFIFLIRRFYKQENFQSLNISVDEFKAIQQQMKELGWLEEETCTNESEYNLVDGFECSNCGIIIENYNEIEIDEDCPEDRCMKEYAPRYCPNCGRKIVD